MSILRSRARALRADMTDAERRLWSMLRHRQLGPRFRRQAPIGPYIADFACFDPRLIIELDGSQHLDQLAADTQRDAWLRTQGFTVLRFWNNDLLQNPDSIRDQILSSIPPQRPPSERPSSPAGTAG